jgi:carboxyl-terminal processing protease
MVDDARPFAGASQAEVVLPIGDDPETCGLRELITREWPEFEAELGAPVRFRIALPGADALTRPASVRTVPAVPTLYVGPGAQNPELRSWREYAGLHAVPGPYVEVDGRAVVVDAPGCAEVTEALSLLRTAVRSPTTRGPGTGTQRAGCDGPVVRLERRPATGAGEAIERLVNEIGWTYPSFRLRAIEWPDLVRRWRPEAERSGGDIGVLQRWVAELRDPHTSVRPAVARGFLPYTAYVDGGGQPVLRLGHVPRWSAGWDAGARGGDVVEPVGQSLDLADLLARSAGEARSRAWFAGRQAMTVTPPGIDVTMQVRARNGAMLQWIEQAGRAPWRQPVSWTRLATGTGYLRIRGWVDDAGWHAAVDAAFEELTGCPRLIVDVRGNVGGNLVAALAFRRRFLTGPTRLGTVRFSVGDGTLGPAAPVDDEPGDARRWNRPVRFLLDRLSYSATEDALFGLRELDHVQFYGEPSGGGSGRPRSVLLHDGLVLNVSTALTFENSGRCVEGQGLAVDVELDADLVRTGHAVTAADAW